MNAPGFGSLPPIPEPMLKEVANDTPYLHLAFDKMGKGRLFYDVVVCKATFALAPGALRPAEVQQPIELADRYWDETSAETSSLKVAGDLLLTKPGCDILITGVARSVDGKPRRHWPAGIRVSRNEQVLAEHHMRLLGPRVWRHGLLSGWTLTEAAPTDAVPLRHELAYGGHSSAPWLKAVSTRKVFAANPAGCGYWDTRQLDTFDSYPAPQIEPLNQPVSKLGADYPLAAPAPLARFWAARTRHAGTYDEAWHEQYRISPIPDFPHDFDERFFQCAHPNLICPQHLQGDERIALAGLLAEVGEVLVCTLPGIGIRAELIAADGRSGERELALDTLHIDLDRRTISLVWRLTLDQRACIEQVRLTRSIAPETQA